MRTAKKEGSYSLIFFLSVLFFAAAVALGMFAAHSFENELGEGLGEYVNSALGEKTGFKKVFVNAMKNDFRYTVIVLFSAFGIYTAFIPLLLTAFKGFSSGLAVAVAAGVIEGGTGLAAFLAAVFFSCVFTVPLYVLMFMLCLKHARTCRKNNEAFGEKARRYMGFLLAVTIVFALLCAANCIQAAIEPLLCSLI